MRIVQVCPYSWDAHGGVQAHVRNLSASLMRRGHEVLVLAPSDAEPTEPHVRIVGRPFRVRFNGSVVPLCIDPTSAAVVRDALEEFAPDIVHVHEPLSPSTSMLGVLYSPAPTVATFHAYIEDDTVSAQLYTAVAPLVRPVWNRVDFRIAVSQAARWTVGSRMGSQQCSIIPNGANVEHFEGAAPAELPAGRKLLFVGRLEPRKGFRYAVRAFAELADGFPDVQLVVVGDGPQRTLLRRLEPRARERVHMIGAVTQAELPTFHAASDIFLAPATGRESFGVVLVEAMAAGLPVVASNLPGYSEVVRPGREALLVPPRNADALARATASLLDNPTLAARLGQAGRLRARTFSWHLVAARVERVYEGVVRTKRRAQRVSGRMLKRAGAA
ncbi:MAG: glycosyltransferase family 4 protein [Gemmatimonadaceae bacterium]